MQGYERVPQSEGHASRALARSSARGALARPRRGAFEALGMLLGMLLCMRLLLHYLLALLVCLFQARQRLEVRGLLLGRKLFERRKASSKNPPQHNGASVV